MINRFMLLTSFLHSLGRRGAERSCGSAEKSTERCEASHRFGGCGTRSDGLVTATALGSLLFVRLAADRYLTAAHRLRLDLL